MLSFISDVRYAVRRMRRSPGFTAVAVVVLALGIGVNTALFSIVNALFFKPLPVRAPEELVYLYATDPSGQVSAFLLPEELDFFREQAADLVEFTSHLYGGTALSADDERERVSGEFVSGSYFDVLGVKAVLGRTLGPRDDDPANPEAAVVIGHDLWTRRFRADPNIIGKLVQLQRRPFTIVGVMEPGFRGLSDFWTPSEYWATPQQVFPGRSVREGVPIVRLKAGVTFEQFRSFVDAKTPQLQQMRLDGMSPAARSKYGDRIRGRLYPVFRARDVQMPFHPTSQVIPKNVLVALTFVVALVLVIASANIAGLLLARGVTRTAEIAVRRALGASGMRLTRQLLTETVLLSFAGGMFGCLVATTVLGLFGAYTPATFALDVPMDMRVLGFAVVVCIATGMLVGTAPALQAAKVTVLEALGSGIAAARGTRRRLRQWVVIPQVGLSLVLLTVAGIHLRSLAAVELKDLGYRTDEVVVLNVWREEPPPDLPRERRWTPEEQRAYAEDRARRERLFIDRMLDGVQRLPNAAASAMTQSLPASADLPPSNSVMTYDAFLSGASVSNSALRTVVSDGYFDVMRIAVLAGRPFDQRDALLGRKVAIVSESLGTRLWTDRQAVGRQLAFVGAGSVRPEWLEVIGVVNEVEPILGDSGSAPRVNVPVRQEWQADTPYLVVRGRGDRAALVGEVKKAVTSSDSNAEIWRAQTLQQVVADILYPRRTAAAVLTAAGLIGLSLACIGLYGVVSYSVAQRLREIGIRATLGAGRRDLVLLLLKDGATVTVVGCLVGLVLAILAQRLTANMLPGLPAMDLFSFLMVPLALGFVVLLACYLPARRAASTDPWIILRAL